MLAQPQNLLVIMSDEHNRKIAGMPGTRSSPHRRWTRLPRVVAASPPPTHRRRSASRRGPVLQPGSLCTVTAPGTTPSPMMGISRVGPTPCANAATTSPASVSCITAAIPTTITASSRACGRCTSPAASAMSHTWCATPTTSAPRARTSLPQPALEKAATPCMTGRSPRPPRSGCGRPARAGMRARGCCLSRWWRRIFRSPHRPSIITVISARICRGRSSTPRLSGRITPMSACTPGVRITTRTLTARLTCSEPWPAILAWYPFSTSRSARC